MTNKPPVQPLAPGQFMEPGISADQERMIGRVCVAWAHLESCMQDTIWMLLGVPIDDGRILTASSDANRKLQWLGAFANKHLTGTELAEMKVILAQIEASRLDRNYVCHGSWGTLKPDNIPMCMSVKEKGPDPTEIVAESFSKQRMEDLIKSITEGSIALMDWSNARARARGELDPYPPGPFPTKK